jgi:multidrug efflux pump subunit AcrB
MPEHFGCLAGLALGIERALDAGSSRILPVLMTALAMIIGMAPMAIEPGQNAPLGRAVIGRLLFATCATLFLVPTMFSVIHARDRKRAEAASVHTAPSRPKP